MTQKRRAKQPPAKPSKAAKKTPRAARAVPGADDPAASVTASEDDAESDADAGTRRRTNPLPEGENELTQLAYLLTAVKDLGKDLARCVAAQKLQKTSLKKVEEAT